MQRALIAATLAVTCAQAYAQAGPAWAWSAGKISNNGAVSVKSATGAGTLNAVQNPIGAVAKTNQSAVTQPPTVIIQATSNAGYAQAMPLLASGTSTIPACPAGYTSIWTSSSSTPVNPSSLAPIFNIGGTRFGFGVFTLSGSTVVGFYLDHMPGAQLSSSTNYNNGIYGLNSPTSYNGYGANLCVK